MKHVPIASAAFFHTSQWKAIHRLAFLSLLLLFTSTIWAQTYPILTCNQTSNTIAEGYSPALTVFNGLVYEAYVNSASGHLDTATSTDGKTFSGPTYTGVDLGTGSPSITAFNNKLYIAYQSGEIPYIISSSNGTTWSSPESTYMPGYPTMSNDRPAIYAYGNYLYFAYMTASGSETVIGYSTNGSTFQWSPVTTSGGYNAVSSTTMTVISNTLFLYYLYGTNRTPFGEFYTLAGSSGGPQWFGYTDLVPVELANEPAAVAFNSGLFIFGQSIYQAEDNLWGIGSLNGENFEAAKQFGASFSGGPGVTVFNGNLILTARSKYDSNIWACQAPPAS